MNWRIRKRVILVCHLICHWNASCFLSVLQVVLPGVGWITSPSFVCRPSGAPLWETHFSIRLRAGKRTPAAGEELPGRSRFSMRKHFPEFPNPGCLGGNPAMSYRYLVRFRRSFWSVEFLPLVCELTSLKNTKKTMRSFPGSLWLAEARRSDKSGLFLRDRRWNPFIHYVKVPIKW